MHQKTAKDLLEGAYDLQSTDANNRYYKDFAPIYDEAFAESLGYATPRLIAEFFVKHATKDDLPIADVGCGTGLVAEALPFDWTVDGLDLSADMLEAAKEKQIYRELLKVDLKKPLGALSGQYGAIISAGTFTHGHLGPENLSNCFELLRPGGIVAITVNEEHFKALGFDAELRNWAATNRISRSHFEIVSIYDKDGHAHADDKARLLSFRVN